MFKIIGNRRWQFAIRNNKGIVGIPESINHISAWKVCMGRCLFSSQTNPNDARACALHIGFYSISCHDWLSFRIVKRRWRRRNKHSSNYLGRNATIRDGIIGIAYKNDWMWLICFARRVHSHRLRGYSRCVVCFLIKLTAHYLFKIRSRSAANHVWIFSRALLYSPNNSTLFLSNILLHSTKCRIMTFENWNLEFY